MPKLARLVARFCLAAGAAVLLSATVSRHAGAQQTSFVVVANGANLMSSISRSELAALFTKKEQSFSDGTPAFPVDLPDDDPIHEAFAQAIHGKSPRALRAYWQQQIFSGRNVPPPQRSSDDQVLAYVRTTVGAIGYVRATAHLGPGIKVLGLVAR
jgi:ABC-type phosphate transport system substrate-binding protein